MDQLTILPGGGINASNCLVFKEKVLMDSSFIDKDSKFLLTHRFFGSKLCTGYGSARKRWFQALKLVFFGA